MGVERREAPGGMPEAERRQRTVQDKPPPAPAESPDEQSGPALTIVCDYDIRRIGLRYDLWKEFDQRKAVKLGRLVFARPGTEERQVLAPVVSAQEGNETVTFRMPGAGGVRLTPGPYAASRPAGWLRVIVGGVERSGQVTVTQDEVKEGVCIQLGHYVLLLLHLAPRRRCSTAADTILGESCEVNDLRRRIRDVKDATSPVLLVGEPGTGKELVARAVHDLSSRSKKPYLPLNCAAIQEGVAGSELFGHVRGSFTGAAKDRKGAFQSAADGTVFLDEIDKLSKELQPMLLRAISDSPEFTPVGSEKPLPVKCRAVAAANDDLAHLVRQRKFPKALFTRLATFVVKMPPLRSRRPDIAPLFVHYLRMGAGASENNLWDPCFEPENPDEATLPPLLPEDVLKLLSFDWPGNVRQLKGAAEAAWHRDRVRGRRLDVSQLIAEQTAAYAASTNKTTSTGESITGSGETRQEPGNLQLDAYKQLDREQIRAAWEATKGKEQRYLATANLLGIPYSPQFKSFVYRTFEKPNQGP
ncbi:MAG: hypothetical protein AMXMBFR64_54540 [Myxococcales bacterium]